MNQATRQDVYCSFIVPIRRVQVDPLEVERLADYFKLLRLAGCEVLIVDGSPKPIFKEHRKSWQGFSRHIAPDPKYTYLNGKVNGVHTGVDLASCERIILADDDIRYRAADVKRMCKLLDKFEMVRPQNFIAPLPWWARLETARILINRAVLRAGDYPGTCGFRRSTMRRVGPYDGDVLFDNEEIVRHFALNGVEINYALDFFYPQTSSHVYEVVGAASSSGIRRLRNASEDCWFSLGCPADHRTQFSRQRARRDFLFGSGLCVVSISRQSGFVA